MMEKHETLYKDVSSLEVVSYFRHSSDFDDGVEFILEKLDAIPVADVQPVQHGKWIKYTISDLYSHTCSICHCDVKEKTPYCPFCGAKMDDD
jgi:hypothetical protein